MEYSQTDLDPHAACAHAKGRGMWLSWALLKQIDTKRENCDANKSDELKLSCSKTASQLLGVALVGFFGRSAFLQANFLARCLTVFRQCGN